MSETKVKLPDWAKGEEITRETRESIALSEHTRLRENIISRWGVDPNKMRRHGAGVWKGMEEVAAKVTGHYMSLKEATAESMLAQLVRYGVQNFMFDAYKSVDSVYESFVSFRTSKSRQEWYAPLYGAELPLDVPDGDQYQDSRTIGLDVELINKVVGRTVSFRRTMFDDDQTGQIAQRASKLGERLKYKEEIDVLAAVDVAAKYTAAIGNIPDTTGLGALTQVQLENADIAAMKMLDPLGNKLLVTPNLLLVSPSDKFNAAKLINSSLQPSVPGASGQTFNTASSQSTGFVMTINPLQGLFDLKVSRFLRAGAAFLMEAKTSIPFQQRDPMEIMQEAINAGKSFSNDVYVWRIRERYQVAVLEYRYIIKIN